MLERPRATNDTRMETVILGDGQMQRAIHDSNRYSLEDIGVKCALASDLHLEESQRKGSCTRNPHINE